MTGLIERFESKFIPEPNSGCWLWIAGVKGNGYGFFHVVDKDKRAHRVAYEIYVGQIPEGMHVLHKCDVPCCVNPDHLWLGTHTDNMADKMRKGRHVAVGGDRHGSKTHPECVQRGELAGPAKLSDKDVLAIRFAVGMTQQQLADTYGITQAQVSNIVLRKQWAHL